MALSDLRYDDRGLVTVVVQDRLTGEIRMLAHADQAALEATLASGEAHFYSRSRQSMWRKGETSGNTLRVTEVWTDCDADAVAYLVEPQGPSCHTGRTSCFFRRVATDGVHDDVDGHARPSLAALWASLEARRTSGDGRSYTRSLLDAGAPKVGAKIREEADELALAIAGESDDRVVSEAADVLYHAMVGLLLRGVSLRDVESELAARFGISGLDEKASRKPKA